MKKAKRFSPLSTGSTLDLDGLKLTLGPSTDLEVPGFGRDGRGEDGTVYRVLELGPHESPGLLDKAFGLPFVSPPVARATHEERTVVALRPPSGPSLRWLLQRGEGLPLWALEVIDSLAALFQGVHAAGLLFRSVTPESFSLGEDGSLRLDDPLALRGPSEPAGAETAFTAPEIAKGEPGDARSDVWALGVLAHAVLAGRVPFRRGALPHLRVFQPQLAHGATHAVMRATRARPSERYETCAAFAADLRRRSVPRGTSPRSLAVGTATEIGRIKKQHMPVNQDASYIGMDPVGRGLLLVADGVSTADVGSGDLASSLLRDAVKAAWEGPVGDILRTHKGPLPVAWPKAALEAILEDANARIYAYLKQPIFVGSLGPATHPPGTTAILAVVDGDRLKVANVGDSRIYMLRDGAREQMTVDQDLRTELLRASRDPATVSDPGALGALTHSVGSFFFDHEGGVHPRPVEPDVFTLHLRAGDRVLFCSDGVPDCLGDEADAIIARELGSGNEPEAIARRLCQLADEMLGADNITALTLIAS